MRCEADFGKCKNEATHKIKPDFVPKSWKPLNVCGSHFKKYRKVSL